MTQEEIKRALNRLRYSGGWSIRALAKQAGVAASTITAAMTTQVSERKQARLSNVIPLIPAKSPRPVVKPGSKRKPGHFKRYLIRYYNLRGWLEVIEQEPGISKRFPRPPMKRMSRERAAYVCARYDYQMKAHLLDLFGDALRARKVVMGDCYPAEQWIERVHKLFPAARPALFKKITEREK